MGFVVFVVWGYVLALGVVWLHRGFVGGVFVVSIGQLSMYTFVPDSRLFIYYAFMEIEGSTEVVVPERWGH